MSLSSGALAQTQLESFQESLVLRQWEVARIGIEAFEPPLRHLVQADFHLSQRSPDLAWSIFHKVQLSDFQGDQRDYYFLIRAQVEKQLRNDELCRRNLRLLRRANVSTIVRLRGDEMLALLNSKDETERARIQELLEGLPTHPLRELFSLRISGALARTESRWAEAASRSRELAAWATRHNHDQLLPFARFLEAEALLDHRPERSLALYMEIVGSLRTQDPPLFQLFVSALSFSALESQHPKLLQQLRGKLLRLAQPGRASWRLAGGDEQLPENVDRSALLDLSLAQAEARGDHQAATWLCYSKLIRGFHHGLNRTPTVRRALKHLDALPNRYPGWTYFGGVSRADILDLSQPSRAEPRLAQTLGARREELLRLHYKKDYGRLPLLTAEYFDALEEELDSLAPFDALFQWNGLQTSLRSYSRSEDPDLLGMGQLKEPLPIQEFFASQLRQRPMLVSGLLSKVKSGASLWQRRSQAALLFHLARYDEADWLLKLVEKQATKSSKPTYLLLESLAYQLRILSQRGQLKADSPALNQMHKIVSERELTASGRDLRRVLLTSDALLLTGRTADAVALLDRLLAAAGDDLERCSNLAGASVFIHRAMAGRLLGESPEKTRRFLDQGAKLCEQTNTSGGAVHTLYSATLAREEGDSGLAEQLYEAVSRSRRQVGHSRLQPSLALAELRGEDRQQAKALQRLAAQKIQKSLPQSIRQAAAYERIRKEVLERNVIPPLTDVFLEALGPAGPIDKARTRRELNATEFLTFLGKTVRQQERANLLLPLSLVELERLQAKLPPGGSLYHPVLIGEKLLKLEVHPNTFAVDEFYLDSAEFLSQLEQWVSLCRTADSDRGLLTRRTTRLRPLLWSEALDTSKVVWLLLPGPLDTLPWPLLAADQTVLRHTDGQPPGILSESPRSVVLAGAHAELAGTRRELSAIAKVFPQAKVWSPDSGYQGLLKLARSAQILHLSGHGKGPSRTGGHIDLGPLQVDIDSLFSLRLDAQPLVVLATCEGALGQRRSGGRSFSLVTPFRAAGARAVLGALWTLEDQRSAGFFTAFYGRLKQGANEWRALHQFRQESRGSHPYYWAGLVLVEGF